MKRILIPVFLLSLTALASCGNNGCEEVRESYCLASFQAQTGAAITELNAWGLGQVGSASNDSVTYTDQMLSLSSPSEMELKLNPNDSITRIYMELKSSYYGTVTQYKDTLTLCYRVDPYYLGMECGCTVYFTITSAEISHNYFKRVTVKNKLVSNETSVNLQIDY